MAPEIDQEIFARVIQTVSKHTNYTKDKLGPRTRISHDLKLDGLDSELLIAALRDEFDIDLSSFVFDRHFGPEIGFNPVIWLYWFLCKRDKLNAAGTAVKKIPITIMDLYDAARLKKFPDLNTRPLE